MAEKISEEDMVAYEKLKADFEKVSAQLETVTLLKQNAGLQLDLYTYRLFDKYNLKPGVDSINGTTGEVTKGVVPQVLEVVEEKKV